MLSIRQWLFLFFLTASVFTVQFYYGNAYNYWLILTAFLFAAIDLGDTFLQRIAIIFITGLLAVFVIFLVTNIAENIVLLAIVLTLITLMCVFISMYWANYFFLILIVNLFAILSSSMIQTNYPHQIFYVFIATAIVAFWQLLYLPGFTRNKIRTALRMTLVNLDALNKAIFSTFIDPNYPKNIYYFEHILHVEKIKFMRSLDELRELARSVNLSNTDKDVLMLWLSNIEYLFSIVLDCAQLRRRVTDPTTFGLCANELTSIYQDIKKILMAIVHCFAQQKSQIDLTALALSIKNLEENYHNVILVTSKEPLVFLLFISSLKIADEELISLYETASPVRELLERL